MKIYLVEWEYQLRGIWHTERHAYTTMGAALNSLPLPDGRDCLEFENPESVYMLRYGDDTINIYELEVQDDAECIYG